VFVLPFAHGFPGAFLECVFSGAVSHAPVHVARGPVDPLGMRMLLLLALGLLAAAIAITPGGAGQLAYVSVYYVMLGLLAQVYAARRRAPVLARPSARPSARQLARPSAPTSARTSVRPSVRLRGVPARAPSEE
jgi:hypothetical protein